MTEKEKERDIPTWDGNPSSWPRYRTDVEWYVDGLREADKPHAVSRLVRKLEGGVANLRYQWKPSDFKGKQGWQKYLTMLAASPYIRRALPDVGDKLDKFFRHHRRRYMTMGDYITDEQTAFQHLDEALKRVREQEELERAKKERRKKKAKPRAAPQPATEDGDQQDDQKDPWQAYDPWQEPEEHKDKTSSSGSSSSRKKKSDADDESKDDADSSIATDGEHEQKSDEMGGWLMGVLRGWLLLRGSGLDKPERNEFELH